MFPKEILAMPMEWRVVISKGLNCKGKIMLIIVTVLATHRGKRGGRGPCPVPGDRTPHL